MMIAAPTSSSKRVEDGGNFSADSQQSPPINSDDEQLDDTPFLSHQLSDDHESFSEKFLRNILTHDYQNLMPRRREKFVEITKTVTVTEIVNGAPDKHPSSCEVKVTNVSPAGPHPVNVSIKHLHEKWHSCEELDKSDDGGDLGKGTVIRIQETHKPFNYTQKKQQQKPTKFVYEDVVNTKMESSTRSRPPSSANSTLFNRSSDNIIDLEFRHPVLIETSEKTDQKQNGTNGTRRRFADLRKKISTTTKTSVTETEKVTTTRRSSSAHSTSSRRSYGKPQVHTLYYRKFVDEETKGGDEDSSDSGSVIIHRDSVTRRSRSADHLQKSSSPTMSPIAPPRKRLGREESLHYYRDDEEVIGEKVESEKKRRVTVKSPEPGNTSVSMNDTVDGRNLTAGITSVSMNDTCTDTSYESRFSTIPRARSSPPTTHRVNHIHVNVIGPIRTPESERRHKVAGRVGEDITMDIYIERRHSAVDSRRGSHVSHGSAAEAPPKPPRRSKYEENIRIGEPIATSTPMTTIERKQTREERVSTESGESSRKSTRSARPPDINIIECETFLRETRSPARTPATPIVVINQTPSSRRGSQDLLGEPGQRRRKSTVTDIDWYAAFNMKDPSSPTKPVRPPFVSHADERKSSRDVMRRRASDSSMIGLPPADIDLNQIFVCTVPPEIKNEEKCQCNACRLIRMSEVERESRIERASRSRQSRSFTRMTEYETRASTLPSRYRTSPVTIELEDIFNPKPSSPPAINTKPPTPPARRRHAPTSPTPPPSQSSFVDEPSPLPPSRHLVTSTIDRKQVTPVTTNSRDSGSQLHENTRNQLLNSPDDWVGQMMNDANEWENRVTSRKSSVLSTSSSTARKVAVARRISVDELRKPEKRKSREAVPLPPSDVSIDDIFTALTPKRQEISQDSEKKTFIVTRKQRAQDVDVIDFEKDRKSPVAPPRSRSAGRTQTSEATITMGGTTGDQEPSSAVSTATINLEDSYNGSMEKTETEDKEDRKIKRRVEDFSKESNRDGQLIDKGLDIRSTDDLNASTDNVFKPSSVEVEIPLNEEPVTSTASIKMRPSEDKQEHPRKVESPVPSDHVAPGNVESEKNETRTSAVSIDLDKVFVEGSTGKSYDDVSDEKIRRGMEEFEKAKQEKEAQRSGIVVTAHSSKHLFDQSDISMDDVFNTSQQKHQTSHEIQRPEQAESTTIVSSDKPTESASFNLENVFMKTDSRKPEEDEEEQHIQRRIEEFKKAEEEKKTQRTTESHSSSRHRIFDDSKISMDDVFRSSKSEKEDFVESSIPDDAQTSTATTSAESKESTSINMEGVFVPEKIKKAEEDNEEEHIRRRIEEFKGAEEEKKIQKGPESHSSSHIILDESNIPMDDVFNLPQPEQDYFTVNKKPTEEEEEDQRIQERIEEFRKTETEKEIQRTTETHASHRIYDDSNVSMDDVFGSENKTDEITVPKEEPRETSTSSITMRPLNAKTTEVSTPTMEPEKEKNRTSAVSIDLDEVFVEGSIRKSDNDVSDEKIRRGIEEFEKAKQEKEAQRSGVVVTTHSSKHLFSESDISMDEVFNTSQPNQDSTVEIERPPQTESVNIVLKDESIEREERHIRERIEEFERAEEEKKIQRTIEPHSSCHFESGMQKSNIPMEDVFNADNKDVEVVIPLKDVYNETASDEETALSEASASKPETVSKDVDTDDKQEENRKSTVSIDLDKVFVEGSTGKSDNDMSDEKIRRGIEEFEKAKQEKEAQRSGVVVTTHSSKHLFDQSDISMDDVFNTSRPQEDSTTDVAEDREEEHILERIEEFQKAEEEKQIQRSIKPHSSHQSIEVELDQSAISMDEVFSSENKETEIVIPLQRSTDNVSREPSKDDNSVSSNSSVVAPEPIDEKHSGKITSSVSIDLDKVFVEGSAGKSSNDVSDEKIRRGIEEFERAKQEKEAQRSGVVVTTHSSKHLFDKSDISMDDVFNTSRPEQHATVEVERPEQTGSDTIIFKDHQIDQEEKHIRERIEEFQKAEEEKKIQRTTEYHDSHEHFESDFNKSNISMDDVFNTSRSRQKSLAPTSEKPGNSAGLNMDSVFVPNGGIQSDEAHEEEEHIRQRIEEFEKAEEEKKVQRTIEPHSPTHHQIFDESNISMEDVFNISQQKPETEDDEEEKNIQIRIEEFKKAEEEKKAQRTTESHSSSHHRIFDDSKISMDDVFNTSPSSRQGDTSHKSTTPEFVKTTSDSEKTTTTTTTRTETTSDSYSKKTITSLDDLFGPQTATPPVISVSAISLDPSSNQPSTSPTVPPRKHQNLSSLLVPGKWNESMMSNASTISLDDSFNNSFVKSGNSTVYEPKLRKPLSLPVDNWIDNMVSNMTAEATKEAPKTPKTPKTPAENYYRSPTRISQEIKYEWVAKLIEDDEENKRKTEEKEGHQSEEEHLQKQDNTWVSSVVYRPTLETSAYTLRASQLEPEHKREDIDMNRVFDECLMGKKKDDEICECSACRLTEQELEELKKRKIETENKTREERKSVQYETRHVTITSPSDISIDDVFNPEVPLSIQTDHVQAPSTSSPPVQSTRTYYISPKVSETVTTTHQWKDADISMDEIFSPVSSTTNENRRFSNFYEDRSGWDTIGSEDSGVMSGGDRGRRRSTRITDHVIDEAFKGIFDSQPTTSSAVIKLEEPSTQYDDYYITSLHQEDVDRSDSDVDAENLDVSQFVDDILGKSLDEAAFLSSTKSLRDYTDTSIDRKMSGDRVHPYYRTRTDTSIDRRVKPAVINEDLETMEHHSNDEIMKLVFVDPNDPSVSKSESRRSLSLPRNKSITKPSDEELLEIEIKPECFIIKGSYSLLIPKSDPLGIMLQKLREQNDSLATLDFSLTRKLKKLLVDCIRERAGCLDMTSASSKYEGLLSSRGQSLIESIDYASATFLKMNVDKYEPTRNPNGVVNFCTAENNICTPLLEERFKHLELFFPNTEHLVRYPPSGGWPEAREVLVKYFKEFMGARVTVDELALTPSTRTGYDVTSYCLFEQDDILLTNGPVYAGTVSNVQEKAQCQVACVETDLSNPRLDVKMYEEELNRQIALENTVSGVIIVNPHNPLGVTFPPEEVVNLCNWAASKNLHVVIDEVFANCVFDKPNSKFRPFLSYRHRVHRPENVAWLWSVSKDFGLPGLKFAVIHSANEGLRQAATKLQMYYPCSPFVQDFAINLLSDSEWLREFHTEVNRRISIHYRYTTENLERLEIPFVPAQAGIFVFADFSKHLSSNDAAGELELFDRIASAGVMLTPGVHQKCHVFGWFRIVFACTKEELEEGFRRLFVHLGSHLHPIGTVQYDN